MTIGQLIDVLESNIKYKIYELLINGERVLVYSDMHSTLNLLGRIKPQYVYKVAFGDDGYLEITFALNTTKHMTKFGRINT